MSEAYRTGGLCPEGDSGHVFKGQDWNNISGVYGYFECIVCGKIKNSEVEQVSTFGPSLKELCDKAILCFTDGPDWLEEINAMLESAPIDDNVKAIYNMLPDFKGDCAALVRVLEEVKGE